MPQKRFWDYASPLPSWADNSLNKALNDAGVYRGMDLGVDSVTSGLLVATGYGLQPDGVMWYEDEDVVLLFTPPGPPTNYTVVATHEDQQRIGGAPVEYEMRIGNLSSITDGVILGWVYHPGGGVPLSTSHLQTAPKALSIENASTRVALRSVELIPPFTRAYHDAAASGPDTSFDELLFTSTTWFLMYERARNSSSAPGAQQVVQHIQFYVDEAPRPVSFTFFVNIPNEPNTNLTIQVYGTDQVLVPVTGSPLGATTGWETHTVTVDRTAGTFDSNEPYTLRLVFNLGIGQEILVGRVKANFWPYPSP